MSGMYAYRVGVMFDFVVCGLLYSVSFFMLFSFFVRARARTCGNTRCVRMVSVSSYSFERWRREKGLDLREVVRAAADMGWDGIEFTTLPAEGPTEAKLMAAELRELCRQKGLAIVAYAVGADLQKGPGEALKLREQVDVAATLGVPVMRHDLTWSLPPDGDWARLAAQMAPLVREVSAYAFELGVRTCSENHGMVFQDPGRMETVMQEVGHPNYGWLVDVGNFMCTDCDPVSSVRRALPYLAHVHVKDFRHNNPKAGPSWAGQPGVLLTRGGMEICGCVPGDGDADVWNSLRAILASGYDGAYSLEYEGPGDVLSSVEEGLSRMRAFFGDPSRNPGKE